MSAVVVMSVIGSVVAGTALVLWRRQANKSRGRLISQFIFPAAIEAKLKAVYPHLTDAQTALVMNGLREYFHISRMAGERMVSMPSKVVDIAWHEFILFTRLYHKFCRTALGRFLHHTPAEAMRTPTLAQDGIKRAWRLACKRQGIDPAAPARLPLLFAMDALLAIPDGYRYSLNCQSTADYCASHIDCGGGCGGSTSGNGCASGNDSAGDGGSGDGGGCGGGCGGD